MSKLLCTILGCLILFPSFANAKVEAISVTRKYVMGDNDSKNDARRFCFLEAKREVLERAGTYVESYTNVKDYRLTKDEISSYTAALLKVDVVKEEYRTSGENMTLVMTVKAIVDTGQIEKQLAKIKQNKSAQRNIREQQKKLQRLEKKIIELQHISQTADQSQAFSLRKERNIIFEEINEIQAQKIKIISIIASRTDDASNYIEIGMTTKEVRSLIGNPRSVDSFNPSWNYGKVWIIFENGIVSCIVKHDCFGPTYSCSFYRKYRRHCVVK